MKEPTTIAQALRTLTEASPEEIESALNQMGASEDDSWEQHRLLYDLFISLERAGNHLSGKADKREETLLDKAKTSDKPNLVLIEALYAHGDSLLLRTVTGAGCFLKPAAEMYTLIDLTLVECELPLLTPEDYAETKAVFDLRASDRGWDTY